jgi:hypothetical protein
MDAAATYLGLPEPDRANHIWRYTPWHRIHPTGKAADLPTTTAPPVLSLTMLDGSEAPTGVSITPAETILPIAPHDDIAAAFIRATTAGNAVTLTIDDGVQLQQPLLLEIEAEGEFCAIHLDHQFGARCEVELVTVASGNAAWFGLLREGNVGQGAILNDVVVNRLGAGRMLRIDGITIDRDAQVKQGTVGAGGSRTKADLRYHLMGVGASLGVNGSIMSSGEQHNDSHIEIFHEAPQTYSRLNWHSSCGGSSRTIGTGMLRIADGAIGSDASQLFHNLLLSKHAEADSIPELEVLENEVVGCGHGTANGPVDEDQMFYLLSRGFSEEQATSLIIAAFLNSTLSEMASTTVHDWLTELLSGGLKSATN